MANGFCPPILAHMEQIAQCATPSTKISPLGFLKYLIQSRSIASVKSFQDDGNGHIRDVIIAHQPRFTASQTSSVDNCTTDVTPVYLEQTITDPLLYKKITIFISETSMSKYCAEASKTVEVGQPATKFMQEFVDTITRAANALFTAIDADLVAKQALNFGRNVTTGLTAAKTLNLPLSTTTYNLNQGIPMLLNDMAENEICQNIDIVGAGLFNAFDKANFIKCCDAAGVDSSKIDWSFYHDINTASGWGANQIGIFERGAVQLINVSKYKLHKGGVMTGASEFFTMALPVACPECNGGFDMLEFDVQLKFNDCNSPGNPRGWQMTLSQNYDLYNIPTNAYQAGDRLTGNNGTFRYAVTNA